MAEYGKELASIFGISDAQGAELAEWCLTKEGERWAERQINDLRKEKGTRRRQKDRDEIQEIIEEARRQANNMLFYLREIELSIVSKDYDHWRDDDSPKGESVPGVRHGSRE